MATARNLRSDLFLSSLRTPFVIYTPADAALEFPIDATYFPAVVGYIAGFIGMEDDEFAVDGRAATLQAMFHAALVGKPARAGIS